MVNMLEKYYKELYDQEVITTDFGFLVYHFAYTNYGQKYISLDDIYVKEEFRNPRGTAAKHLFGLAKAIAKEHNVRYAVAYVEPNLVNSTKRMMFYLRNGFEITGSDGSKIIMGIDL